MNNRATGGKNLQTATHGATAQLAREIRPVAPSQPDSSTPSVLYSSAPARQPPSCSYGGRQLRYRSLDQLKPWQVHQLHVADSIARHAAHPLNIFVTVYWEATFPGTASMPSTFRRAMKRMGQWLRDNGVPRFAFGYVHENPDDAKLNSHVLVHVPARLRSRFNAKVADWFQALDGGVQAEPRNRPGRLDSRLQYMAKGADDFTCRRYGGRRAAGGQGPISIKRAGVAQWLRPRAAAEFLPPIKREGEFSPAPTREPEAAA